MTQRRINPFVAAAHAAILVWAFSVCAIEGARILGWLPLKWAFKLGRGLRNRHGGGHRRVRMARPATRIQEEGPCRNPALTTS